MAAHHKDSDRCHRRTNKVSDKIPARVFIASDVGFGNCDGSKEFDHFVLELYHQTMEQRLRDGLQYGDRNTGRSLISQIQYAGGRVLASGSSDWVVFPQEAGYPEDESYFLHFIINTIYRALEHHAELDNQKFADWIRQRHDQIDQHILVYIAHQLDYFGICP